ncbi:MAG: TIGR03617 family F420-dependent LLM class oxidoreductase [Alphaproteobacteria bacterium]|jgi:probable F420-dependent oxidoreductase|nr:TIGR03617 family F420-dependent LLM class oxidoreductase [Alphaproteobacteria bacterium]
MRVLTTIPQDDLKRVPAAAEAAEATGYDGLVTMENRHNPFLPLAVAATATTRMELATGIAIAFLRSPMAVANMGWDLQRASEGRFVLGLGSQVKGHNERRFSVPWSPPAPRMREYVESLRAIWRCWLDGAPLDYRGEHYAFTLMTPNFVPEPSGQPMPAVTLAAVGPVMLRLAGELADGVRLHPFCTRKYVDEVVLPRVEAGLAARGAARESFEISGGGFIATGPDDASVAARAEWVRQRIGFYGSTRAYWPVFEAHGLEDLGQKLLSHSRQGTWDEMAGEISDDVLRLFTAVGRHDELAEVIEARFGGAADAINASVASDIPGGLPPDLVQDLQRIPSTFTGFSTEAWE